MRLRSTLTVRLVAGFVLGIALGVWLGPRAVPLGEVGKWLIAWVKLLAGPFLFFAIVRSVFETPLTWRAARRLLAVTTINAAAAVAIGLGLTTLLQPGRALSADAAAEAKPWAPPAWSLENWAQGLVPKSVFEPFVENAVLSLALGAVLLGVALRTAVGDMAGEEGARARGLVRAGVEVGYRVFLKLLSWVVQLVPVAVMAVVAKSVGERGLAALGGLGGYLLTGALGLTLQMGVVYLAWVRWAGIPLRRFLAALKRPAAHAVGTNSSLATLPLTLEALDGLGVSRAASTLGACIGTNLNNDGILLYEAMAVLIVAQSTGTVLGLGPMLVVVGLCWLATVGIAGVPEAGIVSLSLVLTQAGLPLDLLPLLLSVDWVLARLRSVTNVASDVVTSVVIDRWMQLAGETPPMAARASSAGGPRAGGS